jgi:hypothetical protein
MPVQLAHATGGESHVHAGDRFGDNAANPTASAPVEATRAERVRPDSKPPISIARTPGTQLSAAMDLNARQSSWNADPHVVTQPIVLVGGPCSGCGCDIL